MAAAVPRGPELEGRPARKALERWHSEIVRSAGPAWGARKVFDEIAVPFSAALGLHLIPTSAERGFVHGVLHAFGQVAAVAVACGWGQDHATAWRESVRLGIGEGVRWCFCFNGPSVRLFDARRTHSRRYAELDLGAVASDEATFELAWRLLRADAFARSAGAELDAAVAASERYRAGVRDSLQQGVHEALQHLTSAFLDAGGKLRRRHRGPTAADAFDESLVVIYRILFLLFAEARGLVPTWHPVFRDSYTIEALRPDVETRQRPRGVWDGLQAIARLAHRGCRAGTLRVPPFNGRLFSPSHAPLAESLPLDEALVRGALLSLTTRQARDGRQRITYADLGVEHLGGVYERVLDFDVAMPEGARAAVLVRGGRRKSTGTFYTPRSLTEHLVRRTLAPLVADASPDAILSLRILDPSMGSGAFLVGACRYVALAYELALIRDGVVAAADVTEAERAGFRRIVAQRCLYGVDINPMAVQLARLSLWLATLAGDRPLTFFDHHLRAGNSLVGASIRDVTRRASGGRWNPAPLPLFDAAALDRAVGTAVISHLALRDDLEDTLEGVRSKEKLFAAMTSADGPLTRWKRIADLWCAGWFDDRVGRIGRGVFKALVDDCATVPAQLAEPLLESAAAAAGRERFFHWTLEFPEVFAAPDGTPLPAGGFDAIVGNPPWDVLRGESGARLTRFTRGSGIYALQGGGHANLYQVFVERAIALARPGGRIGLVLPSGFATDHGCAHLRRHVLDETSVDSLISVENREALFPIHRGLKFLMMTTTTAGRTKTVPCRFGLRTVRDFDALPETGPDEAAVLLSRELLERMSGEQLAIPELRTPADAALAARMAFAHLPAGDPEGWGLSFGRELNATDDRRHFTAGAAGLPVIEGKQLQPFACDAGRSAAFIERAAARSLLPGEPFNHDRLAYRDVASATNRLTLIAAIVPAGTVTTHTVFCLKTALDEEAQQFICGMFNSFVANYLVRLRVGTHVTVAIIERLPLPKPGRDGSAFGQMVSLARRLHAHGADAEAAASHQALAARLYGLTAAEFEHVLETLPLVDRDERDRAMAAFVDTL